ncbi:chromosome replication/partitioning protein, partial [Borreliella garinii]|uniref:chromosome replication/partitioning protein n=1 Tax=Borreliella garinii TaxID=29519 RepID=UPI001AEFBD20
NISIEKVKEIGFVATYRNILKNNAAYVYKENMILKNIEEDNSQSIPIKILMKDKEVYDFCKKDTTRIYFILERLIKDKKNISSDLIIDYENNRKPKKKKVGP